MSSRHSSTNIGRDSMVKHRRTQERPQVRRIRETLERHIAIAVELIARGEADRAKQLLLELVEDEAVPRAIAARMLGVSQRTMEDWAREGKGPAWFRATDGPKGAPRYSRLDIRDYRERRKSCTGFVPDSEQWR
jgi:hypothetical protein